MVAQLEQEWFALRSSPALGEAVARWAVDAGGVLDGLVDGEQLRRVVHDRAAPGRADAVLAVLVRHAAVDGGDDPLAARVVLQLLLPGVVALQRRLTILVAGGLVEDVEELDAAVLAAVTGLIRDYPWRRRPVRVAANLLLDTQMTVRRAHRPRPVVTVPAGLTPLELAPVELVVADPEPSGRAELLELFVWAVRERVVSPAEVLLIVRTQLDGVPLEVLAAESGVSEAALKRRRQRAVARLAASTADYALAA